ncbi:hypothetical protein J7I98_11795 [Streptomyces sp. ISL-98]|uniref:hypothetical protein n=1 Tax=Streptomyces sp. ISL-98 TaxID=2819192 RepID=UPI001BE643D4|nr:hypothetical protein [Streptomyces sp. ISL-98]MBT2506567.1 hypothetical protein [Streptomyces sp. ISL-98]
MRSYLSAALLVLVAVLVPLSALAVWTGREVGNTGRYVPTVAPLASHADVRSAVADRITAEIAKEIDLGPLQDSATELLDEAVLSFTGTPAFRNAWDTVNRAAHRAVLHSLENGSGSSGAVTLDLAPVAQQVKGQLTDDGVPLADLIPVRHTKVTVLESDNLGTWRDAFQLLRAAGTWLPAATLAAAAATLLVAVRRLRALTLLGVALAVGAVLLAVTVVVARSLALGGLPPAMDRAAAGAVYDALTGSLRTTAWVVLAVGLGLVPVVSAGLTGVFRATTTRPRRAPRGRTTAPLPAGTPGRP